MMASMLRLTHCTGQSFGQLAWQGATRGLQQRTVIDLIHKKYAIGNSKKYEVDSSEHGLNDVPFWHIKFNKDLVNVQSTAQLLFSGQDS